MPASNHIVADLLPGCLFTDMFIMPIGSHLAQKNINPKLLLAFGASVAIPSFFIASFMKSFYGFATLYILGFAFNHGMCYMVPVHHGWLWFPENPGLVSGIIIGGFGLGGLIFDNVLTHIVNPDNQSVDDNGFYPDSVNERFMLMWRVLVASWLAISIVGIVMIFPGPTKTQQKPQTTSGGIIATSNVNYSEISGLTSRSTNDLHQSQLEQEQNDQTEEKGETTILSMILSRQFMVIYFMNMLSVITGFFAVNNFKKYGQLNGLTNENYLAWIGSIAAICNSIRFVWSLATDKFSYRLVYGVLLCMQILLDFTIPLIADNAAFYAIWISLILLCEGGHFTLVPNVLKKIFGDKGTTLYGIAFSYTGICSILIVVLQSCLLSTEAQSYNYFFYFNGAASCASFLLLMTLFTENKFEN